MNLQAKILLFALFFFHSFFGNGNPTPQADSSRMQLSWKFKTGGQIHSSACSMPGVIFFGSDDKHVYALDEKSGKLIWSFETGGSANSSPAFSDNKLFFLSMDGFFYALNALTGKLIWKFKTGGEKKIDIWDYYSSDPAVRGDLVYFGSTDSCLYALQKETGAEKWRYKTEGSIHAKPVLMGDTLFAGNFGGYFYALDANVGSLFWKFRTIGDLYFPKGELQKGALSYNGFLWFGSRDYNLYALNPRNGRGVWNMKENGSWIIATPFANDKYIYFGTSDSHAFYCIDISNGETKWKMNLNMRVYGSAVLADNLICFGSFNGKLYAVDKETGRISKTFQTDGSRENYFSVFDSTDAFRKGFSIGGKTLEDFKKGEEKVMALGSITVTPLLNNGLLYFGSTDGNFYAVKP